MRGSQAYGSFRIMLLARPKECDKQLYPNNFLNMGFIQYTAFAYSHSVHPALTKTFYPMYNIQYGHRALPALYHMLQS